MSDLHQADYISTLHRLRSDCLPELENDLRNYGRARPAALVLPCLSSELKREAIHTIVSELKPVDYLKEIVVALDHATRDEFRHARNFFSALPEGTKILWTDGPGVRKIFEILKENDLEVSERGKGRAAWIAFGYVLASGKCDVIGLHDCDIVTYDRELLARLLYPVMSPALNYEFCKGFYSRIADRLYGRAMRLLVTPLLRAAKKILGTVPFLEYLDSFRYPLAGEFSMIADLARVNRIPADWGLEVGVLSEVYRNCSHKRICQAEICENYEHKHQALSPHDPTKGLHKMAIDISRAMFRMLATEGIILSAGFFKSLQAAYLRIAQDLIKRYHDDARMNGLPYDRHEEGSAVEAFLRGLGLAGETYMQDPLGGPSIPNWSRVEAAIPDLLPKLYEAVERDNR